MAHFLYKGYKKSGEKVQDEIEAGSRQEVVQKLKKLQIIPVLLKETDRKDDIVAILNRFARRSISLEDQEMFWAKLALLLKHKVRITQALEVAARGASNEQLQKRIRGLGEQVRHGRQFSEALKEWNDILSPVYHSLVKVGEASGSMENVAAAIAEDLKMKRELKRQVEQALVYPVIVCIACIGSILFIFNFVIPQFADLFENLASMPLYTKIMLETGAFVRKWQGWIGLSGLGVVLFFKFGASAAISRRIKETLIRIGAAMPVFGPLRDCGAMLRFASVMGLMLKNGVKVNEALQEAADTLNDSDKSMAVVAVRNQVRKGDSLADALYTAGILDESLVSIIEAGEKTGSLGVVFEEIAMRLKCEYESRIQKLTSLLEPLMILVMGGVVGAIVVTMLLSILSVNEGIV